MTRPDRGPIGPRALDDLPTPSPLGDAFLLTVPTTDRPVLSDHPPADDPKHIADRYARQVVRWPPRLIMFRHPQKAPVLTSLTSLTGIFREGETARGFRLLVNVRGKLNPIRRLSLPSESGKTGKEW